MGRTEQNAKSGPEQTEKWLQLVTISSHRAALPAPPAPAGRAHSVSLSLGGRLHAPCAAPSAPTARHGRGRRRRTGPPRGRGPRHGGPAVGPWATGRGGGAEADARAQRNGGVRGRAGGGGWGRRSEHAAGAGAGGAGSAARRDEMVTSCSHFSVCSGPEFAFCSVLPIAIRTESLFALSNQAWLLPVTWMSSRRSTNRSTTKASDIRFTECIGVDQSLDNRPCIASLIGSMNGPHQVGGVKM